MKPIVLIQQPDGTVKITVEAIQKMVEDAYNQGYSDGQQSAKVVTCPVPYYEPRTNWLDHVIVTCKTPEVTL